MHSKDEDRRTYEKPQISTVDARTIIEKLGPAVAVYGNAGDGVFP